MRTKTRLKRYDTSGFLHLLPPLDDSYFDYIMTTRASFDLKGNARGKGENIIVTRCPHGTLIHIGDTSVGVGKYEVPTLIRFLDSVRIFICTPCYKEAYK